MAGLMRLTGRYLFSLSLIRYPQWHLLVSMDIFQSGVPQDDPAVPL